jgi:two-component sensor histidine kinase
VQYEPVEAEMPCALSQTDAQGPIAPSLVIREFQHRVANTLTILNAGLRREFAAFTDPRLQEALRCHERHIMAIANLHRFFSSDACDGKISVNTYFESLCAILSQSVLAPLDLCCEAFIDEGLLSAEKCEWLGLAVAELVMNAAKYAFPSDVRGRVRIELVARGTCWCCTVSDNGIGMLNMSGGNGSRIARAFVDALNGQITIHTQRHGTAVSITFNGRDQL